MQWETRSYIQEGQEIEFIHVFARLVDCPPWGLELRLTEWVGVELVGVMDGLKGSVTFQIQGTVCVKAAPEQEGAMQS